MEVVKWVSILCSILGGPKGDEASGETWGALLEVRSIMVVQENEYHGGWLGGTVEAEGSQGTWTHTVGYQWHH